MVQAYNFLASWQLFPEKCIFENGVAPKSGNYKIESIDNGQALTISINWVSLDNEAFYTQYRIVPNDELIAVFFKDNLQVLRVVHEIMPNGYMKITQEGYETNGKEFKNVEVYHKQLSVLPYSASVAGVAIRPTKEGVIKHKALSAMEDQTNMQLDQIKQQIELLAKQAQEIRKRKELSMIIYEAKLSFKPQIGQVYHLYEKRDNTHLLSLVAPQEWGTHGPFKQFVSSVKLLADHTWVEVS